MAKILIKALKGPGHLLESLTGGGGGDDKPAAVPGPATKADPAVSKAGTEAVREARRRRGRRSTILSAGQTSATPTRKSLLGGG